MTNSNRQRRNIRRVLTTCGMSAVLCLGVGCEMLGLSEPPVEQAKPKTAPVKKAKPVKKAEPVKKAPAGEYQRPEYPNNTRRNPFQPDLEVVQPQNMQSEGEEQKLEPLERFSLGELELVAIISEVAVPKAMFIDPDGFGHVLKEGDRIGRNSGVLSDIRDNEVEVTETTGEDEQGQTRLRTIKLREAELQVGEQAGLSDEEKAALEKLLQTEEGREALEARYRDMALGASAVDKKQKQKQTSQPQRDPRFKGLAPPAR